MGAVPFWGMGSWSHLRQCGRAESTCTPSFMLIHSTVWSQYTNVTDRTGHTAQTDIQRSDCTGRTVLRTVAQKLVMYVDTRLYNQECLFLWDRPSLPFFRPSPFPSFPSLSFLPLPPFNSPQSGLLNSAESSGERCNLHPAGPGGSRLTVK